MRRTRSISLMTALGVAAILSAWPNRHAAAQLLDPARSVSVAAFGARGDGAGDDTAAFRQAVAALPAAGGLVNVPAGSYVLTGTVELPNFVRIQGEGAAWEGSVTKVLVRHKSGPAFRLSSYCGLKGLAILYPDNLNTRKPERYPAAIELLGSNVGIESIVFDGAWMGISSAPGGSNTGQSLFRDITGFVHHMGFHLSGGADVSRFEDIHWFVSRVAPAGTEPEYFNSSRVGFEFGRQDGVIMTNCFMIGGKTFLRQLPFEDRADGQKKWTISLGYHISNCWVEAVQEGFVFEGHCSIALSSTNILVTKGGVGVRVAADCLGYNAYISGITVRGFGEPFRGIEYGIKHDIWQPDPRNNLTISDCHVVGGAPAIRLLRGATRANIRGCLLRGAEGRPAILVEPGVESYLVTSNTLSGTPPIRDNAGPKCRKVVSGNLIETLPAAPKAPPPAKPRSGKRPKGK